MARLKKKKKDNFVINCLFLKTQCDKNVYG